MKETSIKPQDLIRKETEKKKGEKRKEAGTFQVHVPPTG